MKADVGASALTRMKGVTVGISPMGVTVGRGVGVLVRVGVRVRVEVAVPVGLGMGVLFSARPGRKSRPEQDCNKSIVMRIKNGLRMKNLGCAGLFPL